MITELKGVWLISHEEGAILGRVTGITIDPAKKMVAALGFKPRKGGADGFVAAAKLDRVGRDVIIVGTEDAAVFDVEMPGRNLKELQGAWVTTMDGDHVGVLVDLDFDKDWFISELELGDGKRLPVDSAEIRLGDEIIVPTEYAERVQEAPKTKYGALGRMFGEDRIDDVRQAFDKMLNRKPEEKKEEEKEDDAV